MKKLEKVNHPNHYKGNTSLECIDCMKLVLGHKGTLDFCLGNAFKYMWRYKNKNGAEDIDKARWYLNYVQHDIERDGDNVPEEIHLMYGRLNDLYIDITDKIANNGGKIDEA